MKKFKKKTMTLKKYAKALKKFGVKTSPKEFSKWFYNNFADANHEIDDHLISDGLCIVKTICINDCSPYTRTAVIPEITRKGQEYFINKFLNNEDKCDEVDRN
jgi:phage antirepressor YoqD-like protein